MIDGNRQYENLTFSVGIRCTYLSVKTPNQNKLNKRGYQKSHSFTNPKSHFFWGYPSHSSLGVISVVISIHPICRQPSCNTMQRGTLYCSSRCQGYTSSKGFFEALLGSFFRISLKQPIFCGTKTGVTLPTILGFLLILASNRRIPINKTNKTRLQPAKQTTSNQT